MPAVFNLTINLGRFHVSIIDPVLGEICTVSFSFAPKGWALCDGRSLPIAGNEALYSLIGATFGGDGVSYFLLPDLRGRVAVGCGQGDGLGYVRLGQQFGAESAAMLASNLPSHTHEATFESTGARPMGYSGGASLTDPTGAVPANPVGEAGATLGAFAPASQANAGLAPLPVSGQVTVQATGQGAPLSIRNPGLGLTHIIALEGAFPMRGDHA